MISKSEFVQVISHFKKQHQIKLKTLAHNKKKLIAFWADPTISTYLARPNIKFVDKHPELYDSSIKEEHAISDHYELRIYKYLPNMILYRNIHIDSPQFYTANTPSSHKDFFNKLLLSLNDKMDDIKIQGPLDIYAISSDINDFILNTELVHFPRFLLHANWKDEHASILFTVLNSNTGIPLVTFFINSLQDTNYFNRMKYCFLMETRKCYRINKFNTDDEEIISLKNYLYKSFKFDIFEVLSNTDIVDSTFKENRNFKSLLAINYSSSEFFQLYPDMAASSDFNIIFSCTINKSCKNPFVEVTIVNRPHVPFIDVSHHLQTDKDDQNCVLYSINFIEAIVNMIKKTDIANHIYSLANSVPNDFNSIKTLVDIIEGEMRESLLGYYNTDTKIVKSVREIEDFHLNQRWELGAETVRIKASESCAQLVTLKEQQFVDGVLPQRSNNLSLGFFNHRHDSTLNIGNNPNKRVANLVVNSETTQSSEFTC